MSMSGKLIGMVNNKMDVSVVIPTYNEEENVNILYSQISDILKKINKSYEIIFVDDGSKDKTFQKLSDLNKKDKNVKIIKFRKNFGQTAAMDAGFKAAKGDIIIAMDADLQNDPKDIPLLLNKIKEGYDVVSGWRKDRKDSFSKKIVSRCADLLRKIIFNDRIHDSGCTLKAYKKECFKDLNLYGEMHRFIPAILKWRGFKIGEVVVKHHARKFGKTKYGAKRTIKGFLDMIVVKFWMQYSARPMHIFGTVGLFTGLLGAIILVYLAVLRLAYNVSISNRPLLLLGILLIVLAAQFLIFGLLADILIKIYYREEPNYNIESIV